MKDKKPFFVRIDIAGLFDFATEPDGEKMSLLRFAKELQKGKSDIHYIQEILSEAKAFSAKKAEAGKKGMENRWLKDNAVITKDNTVITLPNTGQPEAVTITETEAESVTEAVQTTKPKSKEVVVSGKPKRPAPKQTDEEWLLSVKENIAYQHINIDVEISKAQLWAANKNRKCSRGFLLNWFNKIEAPLTPDGAQQQRPRSYREQVNIAAGEAFLRGDY